MKEEQKALFTDTILDRAAARFGLERQSLKILDGFENMVYETTKSGMPYILR